VAVLVVLVVVPNDHVLDAIEVMASPPEVLVRDPGHLVVRQRALVPGEAQRYVLDRLADVGPLLPDGFELPRQLRTRATRHVAADDLGLMFAIKTVPFIEGVAGGASEVAASGDLGNHDSPPSGVSVVPRTSARTVPRNRVTELPKKERLATLWNVLKRCEPRRTK